jgi:putative tricarboxylic transport membrane protein
MATDSDEARGGPQTRWAELVVALLVMAGGAVVIVDSLRVGIAWAEDGPRAGYFPFFIGCILVLTAGWIAGKTIARWNKLGGKTFVSQSELRPVLSMLLPTIVYVFLIWLIGIYVASAIYIAGFMMWQGKFKWLPALVASVGVPVALFLLFEVWFLVPLPKGPLEHLLGY